MRTWIWLALLSSCATASSSAPAHLPGRDEAALQLALTAISHSPWLSDTTGLGPICSKLASCDTVFVEPRVLRATRNQTSVLLPDRLPVAARLTAAELRRLQLPGSVVALADRETCWARREKPNWTSAGFACVVVALVTADSLAPVSGVALNVLSPANGYSWLEFTPTPEHDLVLRSYSYE